MNDCYALRTGWSVSKTTVAALLLPLLAVTTGPVHAADFYWDQDGSATGNTVDGVNLGGAGTWDTSSSLWWPVPPGPMTTWGNTNADRAIFTNAFPTLGIPTLNTVTLNSGIIANQIRFLHSGYTLTGGDLTLDGTVPTLFPGIGEYAVIDSLIAGTSGLTMTGGGAI